MVKEEKITFILGAGASLDYGIYTQSVLPERIKQRFSNSPNNFEKTMNEFRVDLSIINDFKDALYNFTGSIDEWLFANKRYEILGKKIIALLLLNCEVEFDTRNKGWYPFLYDKYLKPKNVEEFSSHNQKFSFITFNYDRSLEFFLHRVLTSHFSSQISLAEEELRKINILHIYGSFGNLPYQNPIDNIPYGFFQKELETKRVDKFDSKEIAKYVEKASNNIALMYGDEITETMTKARKILGDSDKIFFLGFGYHEDNLRKLGFEMDWYNDIKIKGTSRLSISDIIKINNFTHGIINEKCLISSDCTEFIKEIEPDILGFR